MSAPATAGSDETDPVSSPAAPSEAPRFAHASEAEMTRILDFYGVRWEYEPHTFPILWTLDGEVAESFSPDFYLPDLNLYLEMTTLRQRLVRKKNRKLRRLRELYPDLRVKLFYARDFRALMLKYGKGALADGLSGTAGHVGPGPGLVPTPVAGDVGAEADAHGATIVDVAAILLPAVRPARARRRRRGRPAVEVTRQASAGTPGGGSEP
jgi:hypoxanthine phosphoribosyltransferase